MTARIAFLDYDVVIRSAVRHSETVAVYVRDSDGNELGLHLHEDVFQLLAQAALDAEPYQPALAPVDDACDDDPDGLHHAGGGCEEVAL